MNGQLINELLQQIKILVEEPVDWIYHCMSIKMPHLLQPIYQNIWMLVFTNFNVVYAVNIHVVKTFASLLIVNIGYIMPKDKNKN